MNSPTPATTDRSTATTTTTNNNNTNEEEEPICCMLCTERIHSSGNNGKQRRPCCGQQVRCCDDCLYRHLCSVWEDVLMGGRRPLNCPTGCGRLLTDSEIRTCLHHRHFHVIWSWLGPFLFHLVLVLEWLARLVGAVFWCLCCLPSSSSSSSSARSCRYYRMWRYFRHSRKEREDLDRYERWSIVLGLRDLSTTAASSASEEILVQNCPAPNCNYSWIVASATYRHNKQNHEQRRVFFWYEPPVPEQYEMDWVRPDFLHFGGGDPPLPSDWDCPKSQRDGRRMVCAKCHYVFCGLCRQPWMVLQNRHAGKPCREYARTLPNHYNTLDLANISGALGGGQRARQCPGCHTITSRISGCNHMTCPCGTQWCFACGANWDNRHYSCVSRDQELNNTCTIL